MVYLGHTLAYNSFNINDGALIFVPIPRFWGAKEFNKVTCNFVKELHHGISMMATTDEISL
jgi:hypothetical protein